MAARGFYLLEDIKLAQDGRRWAQRLTVPLGHGLVSVDMWRSWGASSAERRIEFSEDCTLGGPHVAMALGLLEERASRVPEGGFKRPQAAKVAKEYREALTTGAVPSRLRSAVAGRVASSPSPLSRAYCDNGGQSVLEHRRRALEEERKAWLEFVPEAARMFASMPERNSGTIELYIGAIPRCPGAVVLTVALHGKANGDTTPWWCESECLRNARGDLGQRISNARAWVGGLRKSRASALSIRPQSPSGSNVVPLGWYRDYFEEVRA